MPDLMRRPDRHNEIEINYLAKGSMTYLFQGTRITIPEKSFAIFWGLVPHQIIEYTESTPYFVCTIPFTQFLEWKLPTFFTDRILKGEVIIEYTGNHSSHNEYILKNWLEDLSAKGNREATLLEMRARLLRMANRVLPLKEHERSQDTNSTTQIKEVPNRLSSRFENRHHHTYLFLCERDGATIG
jgi:hypothetical protein